mmetsp:Transcript_61185/g.197110  ORF Transcript_61185/g.197110 Transcript_61185/m.197110 type:complete len:350 (-) Transcript_61185:245-1294(-)
MAQAAACKSLSATPAAAAASMAASRATGSVAAAALRSSACAAGRASRAQSMWLAWSSSSPWRRNTDWESRHWRKACASSACTACRNSSSFAAVDTCCHSPCPESWGLGTGCAASCAECGAASQGACCSLPSSPALHGLLPKNDAWLPGSDGKRLLAPGSGKGAGVPLGAAVCGGKAEAPPTYEGEVGAKAAGGAMDSREPGTPLCAAGGKALEGAGGGNPPRTTAGGVLEAADGGPNMPSCTADDGLSEGAAGGTDTRACAAACGALESADSFAGSSPCTAGVGALEGIDRGAACAAGGTVLEEADGDAADAADMYRSCPTPCSFAARRAAGPGGRKRLMLTPSLQSRS